MLTYELAHIKAIIALLTRCLALCSSYHRLVRRINNELLVEEDSDDSDYDEKEAEGNHCTRSALFCPIGDESLLSCRFA